MPHLSWQSFVRFKTTKPQSPAIPAKPQTNPQRRNPPRPQPVCRSERNCSFRRTAAAIFFRPAERIPVAPFHARDNGPLPRARGQEAAFDAYLNGDTFSPPKDPGLVTSCARPLSIPAIGLAMHALARIANIAPASVCHLSDAAFRKGLALRTSRFDMGSPGCGDAGERDMGCRPEDFGADFFAGDEPRNRPAPTC